MELPCPFDVFFARPPTAIPLPGEGLFLSWRRKGRA